MRTRPGRRFAFRLAAHLGYTVDELLTRITARELAEWQAFERLEGPLGGARGDVHAAMITAAITNANRSKGPPKKPAEFLPQWDKAMATRQQTADEMFAQAKAITARLGGTNHTT
ncbi:Protein of unknown function [Actinopolyspora alba]|uniref:Minor tail T domain-containing protein n=1 Tax=Actinopolyspora alba TaxID=673379 RepID=A0A1I2BEL8_9ACTN|nr:DUF4035 domain-containing protein [Actinopolyspora alba]SFE54556.1 Protein of unknown function [Actinopolyspora alba]